MQQKRNIVIKHIVLVWNEKHQMGINLSDDYGEPQSAIT